MPNSAVEADTLTRLLRDWLETRQESAGVIATALIYELVALIAREAPTISHGHAVLERFVTLGHDQLRELGLGTHP